ncbi:MAG: hypothetical protein QF362_01710 [Candidatus Woesearchaeota archaeon]|jgi:phosphoribosylcarboxyaminoimidazole (NCAIR) mutase|nr:hypothetical protein [Candidatus Woesearchaeota archaeon]MDP7506139.1 hypothetical protein [Candidatus Woesearchaeota archaeon]|tara:strand:- start:820 stop:1701 length:882 start_codon:yes stop_codon:yes gene_type:complete
MKRILFLGAGSGKDPGFDDVIIGDEKPVPYKYFMEDKGITVIDNIVESCHGCPDIMSHYSEQMQDLVEEGCQVVAVLQGGLYFALPSIQATQVTYPIISVPLDTIAFQGFIVPSGHAAIASVGIEEKVDGTLEQEQRAKALIVAERFLNLPNSDVQVVGNPEYLDELCTELEDLDINALKESDSAGLVLMYGTHNGVYDNINPNQVLIRADNDDTIPYLLYLKAAEERHKSKEFNIVPTVQVKGLKNLAIYAAKIISLQRPELRENLERIADKKYGTYQERNLIDEIKSRRVE